VAVLAPMSESVILYI